jgi:hypothetical protein
LTPKRELQRAARRLRRDAGRPEWFFLDKIFNRRKFKIVKRQKHTPAPRAKPAAITLEKAKPQNHNAKPDAISPRTKLPVKHPESQAVERIHYDMQTSLNSHPDHKDED